MKKLITIACAFAVTLSVNAQDYTPKSGDWGISTDASSMLTYAGNLFNGTATSPTVNFQNDLGFHGKYFTDDMTAWRAGVHLGLGSYSDTTDHSESSFALNVQVGREFRKGSSRLQGVYGYGASLGMASASAEHDGQTEYENSMFSFGATGFIGVEYFFKPKMSLGAEYHHGIMYHTDDVDTEFDIAGGTTAINLNFYF